MLDIEQELERELEQELSPEQFKMLKEFEAQAKHLQAEKNSQANPNTAPKSENMTVSHGASQSKLLEGDDYDYDDSYAAQKAAEEAQLDALLAKAKAHDEELLEQAEREEREQNAAEYARFQAEAMGQPWGMAHAANAYRRAKAADAYANAGADAAEDEADAAEDEAAAYDAGTGAQAEEQVKDYSGDYKAAREAVAKEKVLQALRARHLDAAHAQAFAEAYANTDDADLAEIANIAAEYAKNVADAERADAYAAADSAQDNEQVKDYSADYKAARKAVAQEQVLQALRARTLAANQAAAQDSISDSAQDLSQVSAADENADDEPVQDFSEDYKAVRRAVEIEAQIKALRAREKFMSQDDNATSETAEPNADSESATETENEVEAQAEGAQTDVAAQDAEAAESDEDNEPSIRFDDLGLSPEVIKAIKHEGFEQPTPIQTRAIPTLLSGVDMIGQAQTGTGKTAAFALPILSTMPPRQRKIFALVLEPTRELALQVAESFSGFARYIDNFIVAPIYGGASYENQIRSLKHGAQVVVATPGRLIDLIEKGRLDLSDVHYVVIDEADEMLRMGFIDDVEWILDQAPWPRQTALFSATMPPAIRKIAQAHLVNPQEVRIESHTTTATTVRQRYWVVSGVHKIDAMTRMLEVEPYEAVLVFVRTKVDAEDVANKLAARGLACAALHGDIPQRQREKLIERLKKGSLDILIATDVAARGLDVDRITHVFNYDIPYDAESYVHRIGRTGRAGRTGEAILFVSPRERRALRQIERVTHQKIEPMRMPTVADVNKRRLENFRNQILETIEAGGLEDYLEVISDILSDDSIEPELLAAALAKMSQRDGELLLDDSHPEPSMTSFDDHERPRRGPSTQAVPLRDFPDIQMVRYRVAVGRRDGVKPGQIVGAIANEGDIDSRYIGEISIYDSFSIVDLPTGMPKETMEILAHARVCGRALELREYTAEPPKRRDRPERRDRLDRPERDRPERSERDRFDLERGPRAERPGRGGLRPERFIEDFVEEVRHPRRKDLFGEEPTFGMFSGLDDVPDFSFDDEPRGGKHSRERKNDWDNDRERKARPRHGKRERLNLVSPPRGNTGKNAVNKRRSGSRRHGF